MLGAVSIGDDLEADIDARDGSFQTSSPVAGLHRPRRPGPAGVVDPVPPASPAVEPGGRDAEPSGLGRFADAPHGDHSST